MPGWNDDAWDGSVHVPGAHKDITGLYVLEPSLYPAFTGGRSERFFSQTGKFFYSKQKKVRTYEGG